MALEIERKFLVDAEKLSELHLTDGEKISQGYLSTDIEKTVRVRNGEPKYLIRELFAKKYPNFPVPNKTPMPRPVDSYFEDWQGPTRSEFKKNLDMEKFTGNQKWQLWCLERFLNLIEKN